MLKAGKRQNDGFIRFWRLDVWRARSGFGVRLELQRLSFGSFLPACAERPRPSTSAVYGEDVRLAGDEFYGSQVPP